MADILRKAGNALDSAIAVFSPQTAVKRREWRDAFYGYEAASPTRKDLPFPADGRAEGFNKISRGTLRARARHLDRNSDVIHGIISAFENNVIGVGLNMQADTKYDAFNKRIEALWSEWKHHENCDATNAQSIDEMERMAIHRWLVDGGLMFNYVFDPKALFPLKIQVREVDEIDDGSNPQIDGENILSDGVEINKFGAPVAYWLSQTDANGYETAPVRIPAANIDFLWIKSRPSEYREISPLGRSITRVQDIEDYANAVAFQQKMNACTSAFVEKEDGGTGSPGRMANQPDGKRIEQIRAGSVTYLQPGEKLKTLIPIGQGAEFESFLVSELRIIMASHGISLESGTRNVERVNYSSARQNLLADQRTYSVMRAVMIEHLLRPMYRRFVDSCYLAGLLDGTGFRLGEPEFYKAKWLAAGLSWIDPKKEADADSTKLATGGMSFQEYCAANGADWKERIDDMAAAQEYAKSKGVTLNFSGAKADTKNADDTEDGDGDEEGADKTNANK